MSNFMRRWLGNKFVGTTAKIGKRTSTKTRLQTLSLEERVVPAVYSVTTTADSGAGSLRQALTDLGNSTDTTNAINFSLPDFSTIQVATAALPSISKSVSITGPGSASLTIDGLGQYRIFKVDDGVASTSLNVSITGLSIANGSATGTTTVGVGGGIINNESLTLTDVVLSNNKATGTGGGGIYQFGGTLNINSSTLTSNGTSGSVAFSGGGIYLAAGTATLTKSLLQANSAIYSGTSSIGGGAIYVGGTASASFVNSTVDQNSTANLAGNGGYGGGALVYAGGKLSISGSTFSGNSAPSGGGGVYFWSSGTLSIVNSTFSNNISGASGGTGSALYLYSPTATILNSTIANNISSSSGSAITGSSPTITLYSTIVGNNTGSSSVPDAGYSSTGSITANYSLFSVAPTLAAGSGNNISGTSASPLNVGVDLSLNTNDAPAGTPATLRIYPGGPAVNNGANSAGLTFDQRGTGFPRGYPVSTFVDIGAYELASTDPALKQTAGPTVISGGTTATISVLYADNTSISVSSATNLNAITITGPNGPLTVTKAVASPNADSQSLTVTYTFTAPDGTFDAADNGVYTVTVGSSPATDVDNNQVPTAGTLGTFKVGVPGIYQVTTTADTGAGSLRQAILDSNSSTGTFDSITFTSGANGVITLGSALPTITDSVTFVGNGPTQTVIDGANTFQPFNVNDSSTATVSSVNFSNLTIQRGRASTGGAIIATGEMLTLNNVVLKNNAATTSGGAIYLSSSATLNVSNSTFSNDTVAGSGGAIYANGTNTINVTNSTLANNIAGGSATANSGGAIYISGNASLAVTNSTLSGNSANYRGGALFVSSGGTVTFTNSTLANNLGGVLSGSSSSTIVGGAIAVSSTNLQVISSTLTGNTAVTGNGGAIAASYSTGGASATITSSIIAQNSTTLTTALNPDIVRGGGTVTINNSVIGSVGNLTFTGTGNQTGASSTSTIDAKLSGLGDFGGPTQTVYLRAGSPAINLAGGATTLTTDQRGLARVVGGTVDAGAVEFNGSLPYYASNTTPGNVTAAGIGSVTIAVTYGDDTAINVATANGNTNAISAVGPNGPLTVSSAVVDTNTNGSPRTVTYTLTPVGGGNYGFVNNGTYTISLNGGQVFNTAGAAINGRTLTTFSVAVAGNLVVTNLNDSGAGSLRQAILDTNASATSDSISFQSGLTGTIALTSGVLSITDSLAITGPGSNILTISGSGSSQILNINNGTSTLVVPISGLSFTQGSSSATGGAIQISDENVTLTNVVISSSTAATSGGAIATTGAASVTIVGSSVFGNVASGSTTAQGGGGFYGAAGVTLTVTNSTFSGNTAVSRAGAIGLAAGTSKTVISNSTFADNTAALGGGAIGTGGGSITLNNSTVARNSGGTAAGGIASFASTSVTISNSIVGDNLSSSTSTGLSGTGTFVLNNSLFSNTIPVTFTGTGNAIGAPTGLSTVGLASNGAAATVPLTIALIGGAGVNLGATTTLTTDARGTGFPRTVGFAPDAGAFESSFLNPLARVGTAPNVTTATATTATYTFTVVYTDGTAIKASSAQGILNAVTVTGPNGFSGTPTAAVIDTNTDGTPRTVTYTITAPVNGAAGFDGTDNGTYTISVGSAPVTNTSSVPVLTSALGTFTVTLPSTYLVTTDSDAVDANDGYLSLREALAIVNAAPGLDTITFSPTVFNTPHTITLTNVPGVLTISDSLTINGPGSDKLTISGNSASQIFSIAGTGTLKVSISGATLTKGTGSLGGAINIDNESVTLTNVVLTDNTATTNGGAVYITSSGATLNLVASTLSGNKANGTSTINGGGAVFAYPSGTTLNVTGSTVSGNSGNRGGGIYFYTSGTTATVTNSTFSDNTSTNGGGGLAIYGGSLTVNNSTFARNAAGGATGGGIGAFTTTAITVNNSIIGDNTSSSGATEIGGTGTFVFNNSLIASKTGLPSYTGTGSVFGVPTGLDTAGLKANGAAATVPLTIALLGGAAVNLGGATTLTYDERGVGFPRVVGGGADAGAFESSNTNPGAKLITSPNVTSPTSAPYTFTVTYSSGTAIKASSAQGNTNAVTVTGPNNFTATINGAVIDTNTDGTPRTVTYTFAAPVNSAAGFEASDNGVYTISVGSSPVTDTALLPVQAGQLGSFTVGIGQSYVVTNTLDTGTGSLRAAITLANANVTAGAVDTITFQSGLSGTITLGTAFDTITDGLRIDGAGAIITISGGGTVRPFYLDGPGTLDVQLSKLTITQGTAAGAASAAGLGGLIYDNGESITLSSVTLSNGVATTGGAVYLAGGSVLTATNSTVTNNTASSAGAIYLLSDSTASFTSSLLSSNTASSSHGGVFYVGSSSASSVIVRQSLVSGNKAASYGGMVYFFTGGSLLVENSTLEKNESAVVSGTNGGGAIANWSNSATITNSTIINNISGSSGGAVYNASTANVTVTNSIIAKNTVRSGTALPDITNPSGTVTSNNSLFGVAGSGLTLATGSANNLTGTAAAPLDPQLLLLGSYGGPTQSYYPATGSPVIDAGTTTTLTVDQRGLARVFGTKVDIGSVEYAGGIPSAKVATVNNVTAASTGSYTFTLTYTDDTAIDASSVNGNTAAVTVSGPTGNLPVTSAVIDTNTNGTPRTVTYTITPPANPTAGFDAADNGTYTITLNSNQAKNTGGVFINGGQITTFKVAVPAIYTVTTDSDVVDAGDGVLSLREALTAANSTLGTLDTITFDSTVFNTSHTITLVGSGLTISDGVSIDGKNSVVIDGAASYRDITISGTGTASVTLANLILQNGSALGGAGLSATSANLTLSGVTVQNNTNTGAANGGGAAVSGVSTLTITNSTFKGNTIANVSYYGGGLYTTGTQTVSITKSTFSGNTGGLYGGGAYLGAGGTLAIQNSTFSGNAAGNATSAYSYLGGAGLSVGSATTTIDFSTFAFNTATKGSSTYTTTGVGGGGLRVSSGTVTITNSIIAMNTGPNNRPDINRYGGTLTISKSVIGVGENFTYTNGGGNASGTVASPLDPQIGALASNGGPTQTHQLLGGPAVNLAGSTTVTTDQRGSARTVGGGADAGAYESSISNPGATVGSAPNITAPTTAPYTFTVVYADGTAINAATAQGNTNAVTVTGPNSFTATITSAVIDTNTNGTPRTVMYTFAAPVNGAAGFESSDNGIYTISVGSSPVQSVSGLPVLAGQIGSFSVGIGQNYVVSNLSDDGSAGTLRAAIIAANTSVTPAADTISFQDGLTGTITLASALPTITDSVNILGPGLDKLAIDGAGQFQILNVTDGTATVLNVTVSGLTLTKGSAATGGAIGLNGESLTLNSVVISNSTGTTNGGAIGIVGLSTLTINDSSLVGNVANGSASTGILSNGGGAIYNSATGTVLNINRSTLSGNAATFGRGGGIYFYVSGTVNVTNSTFFGNTANADGGAIESYGGTVNLINSTIAKNSSTNSTSNGGGGLGYSTTGTVTLVNSIVGDNTGASGTDIGVGASTVNATNSLISATGGYTLSGTSANNKEGVATGLDTALNSNGAAATVPLTLALLSGSAAINAGTATTALTTDQRGTGFARLSGSAVDIGAFEVQQAAATPAKVVAGSLVINAGATQRSALYSVAIDFTDSIALSVPPAFTLTPTAGGPAVTPTVTLTNGGKTAVLSFGTTNGFATSLGKNGLYTLSIDGSKLTTVSSGLAVDGDGDGTAGGTYTLAGSKANGLFRLYGDANGSGAVDAQDVTLFLNTYGTSTGNAAYRDYLDSGAQGGYNGAVDAQDVTDFLNTYGVTLP